LGERSDIEIGCGWRVRRSARGEHESKLRRQLGAGTERQRPLIGNVSNRRVADDRPAHVRGRLREKYIEPPHTTDFAILFIPTESLYAEAASRPGLAETLQRDYKVMLAGPMNLAALLNSLQLGFRTLAIEKSSTEVWRVLGAVKTEFGKFGELLAKAKQKLDAVGTTLDDASRKSTTIARKLRDVETLPQPEADRLLIGSEGPIFDAEPELEFDREATSQAPSD